ncbi:MAG: phosphonoacetaldehyde hydrolase [Desulfobulbaceae bacterium]|nr:phosphonoacetaldehyde hydrolase [Desulfobulbaceae bacterium]
MSRKFIYSRTYKGPVQLVVFDWAGTTVDFGCQAPVAAFVAGFKAKGISISMTQARIPMGMEKKDHIKAVTEMKEVAVAWEERHGRAVTRDDIDSMFEDFVPLLMKIIKTRAKLIPGVLETISELRRQDIKIGSSTGYFHEAAEAVRQCAAAEGYIPDASICASDVVAGRPAPWMIYGLMEKLDVYPPESVINVGDTVVDIESGLNAGVWSIGVAATGNETGLTEEEFSALPAGDRETIVLKARKKLSQAGAHWVVDTMSELPEVVTSINVLLRQGQMP